MFIRDIQNTDADRAEFRARIETDYEARYPGGIA